MFWYIGALGNYKWHDTTQQWPKDGLYTWRYTRNKYKMGEEWLENRPIESNKGVLNMSQQCALDKSHPWDLGASLHPWVHQTQHNQLDKKVDCPAAFGIGVVLPGVLHVPHNSRMIHASRRSNRPRERAWMNVLWGVAEHFRFVCFGGGWRVTSLLFSTSWEGQVEWEVLSSSTWNPVTGHMDMV